MKYQYTDARTQGQLHLIKEEKAFDRLFFIRDRKDKFLTIAWNNGPAQEVVIDEVAYPFPGQSILPLMVNQSFTFEKPEQVIAWQYNRDFYCIVTHDKEVSCVGFLFYGSLQAMFITLDEMQQRRLSLLLVVFIDELQTSDSIQLEMLQMLLKRLIIIVTRLAKEQYVSDKDMPSDSFDMVRRYNLLVENHYRKQHSVQFYAAQLNKSPKTLSNLFARYNHTAPLLIIQHRLILEAKRLLYYTDKSAKEIAFELGFEDAAYFSNFFKKHTSLSPSLFKKQKLSMADGK
jgi:AraC-like DNA-binding protein